MKNRKVYVTTNAKAFSCEGVDTHEFMVENDRVYVWDSVADHYTSIHALTVEDIYRIKALAENQLKAEDQLKVHSNNEEDRSLEHLIYDGMAQMVDGKIIGSVRP